RPSLSHDPGVDVGAVGSGASREDAVVPVHAVACARQFPTADMALQFPRRRLSARPRLSFWIDACLLPFGGIDALQADACPGDFEAVAVEHARATDQWRPRLGGPMLVAIETEQADQQHKSD